MLFSLTKMFISNSKPPTVVKKSQDYNLLLLLFNHPAVSNSVTPWTAANQASLSLTSSQCLPKFMSIASVMPSSHLILWYPLLRPSIFPSIRDFSNESAICIRWPNYWSFNFSINPPNEYLELISLVGSPCSPRDSQESSPAPQFKGINVWCSAFFTVQLSEPYVTTGKTIALTIQTFVSRVISLLFNTLSRFVTAFLPKNKHL